jgi:ketosteroid isomerase-like protein
MKMRHILSSLAVLAALSMLSACSAENQGQTGAAQISAAPAAQNDQAVAAELELLERQWAAAIVSKDVATIERLLADDFEGTTNDQVYTKFMALEDVKAGTHEQLALDDINVRVFGDTAIATMGQEEKSRHGDEVFDGRYLFTNVWVRRNGQWQAVASHGSRIR